MCVTIKAVINRFAHLIYYYQNLRKKTKISILKTQKGHEGLFVRQPRSGAKGFRAGARNTLNLKLLLSAATWVWNRNLSTR